MLHKIRLSDATRVKGLKQYPKGFIGRGAIYMYFDGGAHNRRIYELVGDVLIPLFSFHEKGFGTHRIVEYFDIEGRPLLSGTKPFENLPDAIRGVAAPDPKGLPFLEVAQTGGSTFVHLPKKPLHMLQRFVLY